MLLISLMTCRGRAIRPSTAICSRRLKASHWLLTDTIVFASIRADESSIQTPTSSRSIQQALQIIDLARLELKVVRKVPCCKAAPIRGGDKDTGEPRPELAEPFC